jgi:beta-propeller repeat-containing protein
MQDWLARIYRSAGFLENKGQVDGRVRYYLRYSSRTLWLTDDSIVFDLQKPPLDPMAGRDNRRTAARPPTRIVISEKFAGARLNAPLEGREVRPCSSYFFSGRAARRPRSAKSYGSVVYRGLWDGIDLALVAGDCSVEQELFVHAGADPGRIRVRYSGIDSLRVDADGALWADTPFGSLRESAPKIFQEVDGRKVRVVGGFKLLDRETYCFELAAYDRHRTLVIDPTISFAMVLGGNRSDEAFGVAVDGAGVIYVTGRTASPDFPVTGDAFQPQPGTGGGVTTGFDCFVARFAADGSTLLSSTYLGGTGNDEGRAIAVDGNGNAYVTGCTTSPDFPTANAIQTATAGPTGAAALKGDAFVAKLSPDGSSLIYATFLGGAGEDCGNAIAVDGEGHCYVAGETTSPNFPTVSSLQPLFGGPSPAATGDAFVTKLSPDGSSIVYSTFLGGSGDDGANGIAVDESGSAYVAGFTGSQNFPTTPGAFQRAGAGSAFVAKLNQTGSALVFSSYLGGSDVDQALAIAVDRRGDAYVAGLTSSADFPTVNAFQPAFAGGSGLVIRTDAFVTKFAADGSSLVYSTYLGGSANDQANGIAVDSEGAAYVTGRTLSTDFPTFEATQPENGGNGDAFVAKFSPDGSTLHYSTYLGGSDFDEGHGIAIGAGGAIVVVGVANSTDFPALGGLQAGLLGENDSFVVRIETAAPLEALSLLSVVPSQGGDIGEVTVVIRGSGFAPGATARLVRTDEADVEAAPVTVSADGLAVIATLDLRGRTRGAWDVVVTNSGRGSATLAKAFNVEEGKVADLWVDIVGRPRIRVNKEEIFTVLFGNRGNVDATGVPLAIRGIPEEATWSPGFSIVSPLPLPGQDAVDFAGTSPGLKTSDGVLIPLIIPKIPAGFTGSLPVRLSVPALGTFQLRASIAEPMFGSPMSQPSLKCLGDSAKVALDLVIPEDCILALQRLLAEATIEVFAPSHVGIPTTVGDVVKALDEEKLLAQFAQLLFDCMDLLSPALSAAKKWAQRLNDIANLVDTCRKPRGPSDQSDFDFDVVAAVDPNEKVGSGVGPARYVSVDQPLQYAVYFENLATATAAAQEVVVRDVLDIDKVDATTLALSLVVIGDRQLAMPPGSSEISAAVDLRPARNLGIVIDGGLDTSGVLTWRLRSVNPETGQPPDDPAEGLLPPNTIAPEGQGSVWFTIMPRRDLPTGTRISNRASIVFDANAPIATAEWINVVDNQPPASRIGELPSRRREPVIPVNWYGTDQDSGVLDFTIYVSEDDGPFTEWLRNTPDTSALFTARIGHTYGFVSTARDRVGNVEIRRSIPDTTTTVTG